LKRASAEVTSRPVKVVGPSWYAYFPSRSHSTTVASRLSSAADVSGGTPAVAGAVVAVVPGAVVAVVAADVDGVAAVVEVVSPGAGVRMLLPGPPDVVELGAVVDEDAGLDVDDVVEVDDDGF